MAVGGNVLDANPEARLIATKCDDVAVDGCGLQALIGLRSADGVDESVIT